MEFNKYGKIYALGHEDNATIFVDGNDDIYIEEKIDGANFRFMAIDGRIIFGSRTQSLGDSNQEIGGNWARCVKYILEQTKDKSLPNDLLFFGECCVKHSLEYDWESIPPYLGFDIDAGNGYVDYDKKKKIFETIGLPIVPLISITKAKDIPPITDAFIPKSAYASGPAEGVCFKNYSKKIFAKYVTEKFKEVNKDAFGLSKKFAENDDERIVAAYCTNPRIDKHVFNLIQEGNKLDFALMQYLPHRVIEDVYAENWKEIVDSKYKVDFQHVRKLIAGRCKAVLQQIMVNNALQKKE